MIWSVFPFTIQLGTKILIRIAFVCSLAIHNTGYNSIFRTIQVIDLINYGGREVMPLTARISLIWQLYKGKSVSQTCPSKHLQMMKQVWTMMRRRMKNLLQCYYIINDQNINVIWILFMSSLVHVRSTEAKRNEWMYVSKR